MQGAPNLSGTAGHCPYPRQVTATPDEREAGTALKNGAPSHAAMPT
nr:hypothetical protein RVX_1783 [Nitratidesulfovibrio sp. HK-II]